MSSDQRYQKWKNNCSPSQEFRRGFQKTDRRYFKNEIRRWQNDNDHEIINQFKPTSAKWEWN